MTTKELYDVASKTESCFICGTKLNWDLGSEGRMMDASPTLDRAENENVIRRDNILILCYKCNATKRDGTLQQFLDYCKDVVTRFHSHFE